MKSSKAMILAVMNAILAIAKRSLKNSGLQRGLKPVRGIISFCSKSRSCALKVRRLLSLVVGCSKHCDFLDFIGVHFSRDSTDDLVCLLLLLCRFNTG